MWRLFSRTVYFHTSNKKKSSSLIRSGAASVVFASSAAYYFLAVIDRGVSISDATRLDNGDERPQVEENTTTNDRPVVGNEWGKLVHEFWSRMGKETKSQSDDEMKTDSKPEKPEKVTSLLESLFSFQDNEEENVSSKATRGQGKDNLAVQGDASFGVEDFLGLLTGSLKPDAYIKDIVLQAQQTSPKHKEKEMEEVNSFPALVDMFTKYQGQLKRVAAKYLGNINLDDPPPLTALLYYLEREDEVKNPSWKRRMHRYYRSINIDQFHYLNRALNLADLCYADSVEEIEEGLAQLKEPYELVYAQTSSAPGKPAHFLAVKRNTSIINPFSPLDVLLGIRGTKTVADALTDLLCDEVEYRGGKAHSFMVESGRYVANKHLPLLEALLEKSNKFEMNLTIVGHSLGGGAASIAGMELHDKPNFNVNVVGFGSPALLNLELAQSCKPYILTVVNDCDVVPRLSGITLANAMLRIRGFDWLPYAQYDIDHAIDELGRQHPGLVSAATITTLKDRFSPVLLDFFNATKSKEKRGTTTTPQQLEPVLYPPGRCVHLYRDGGSGVATSMVPNDFFNEIDVTRTMVDDHLFHSGYEKMFLELLRYHTEDHHFRFDSDEDR